MSYFKDYFKHLMSELECIETADQAIELLMTAGILDHTLIKVICIREYVKKLTNEGQSKLSAMWKATEEFCCTYEYVRKCMYYYKDINLPEHKLKTINGNEDRTT